MVDPFIETDSTVTFNKLSLLFKKEPKLAVTTYHWPDLDGVACVLGLSELLNKSFNQKKEFLPIFFKEIHPEAKWILNKLSIRYQEPLVDDSFPFIVLDASARADLDPMVRKVLLLLDHREYGHLTEFPTSQTKRYIERVGALATVISEFYQQAKIIPSQEIAKLLCAAIYSNTLHLSTSNTNERDIHAFNYLLSLIEEREPFSSFINHLSEMAEEKTRIFLENIPHAIDRETSSLPLYIEGYSFSVSQLETPHPLPILRDHFEIIQHGLHELTQNRKTNHSFLVCPSPQDQKTYIVLSKNFPKDVFIHQGLPLTYTSESLCVLDGVIPRKELIERICILNVPKSVFKAYIQGGTDWPQIRGGIHIHVLYSLLCNSRLHDVPLKIEHTLLMYDQLEASQRSMHASHRDFNIQTHDIPLDALQREWEKSRNLVVASLVEAKETLTLDEMRAIAREALSFLKVSGIPFSILFTATYRPLDDLKRRVDIDRYIEFLDTKEQQTTFLKIEEPRDQREYLLKLIQDKLKEYLSQKFPQKNIDWIIKGFEL